MRYDFIIGNPPYQHDRENTSDKPVYHEFMENAFKLGDSVMLVTPARFLFKAGGTPKDWNEKMLNDEHFKVSKYVANSKDFFPNTDIKGGVAITFRDSEKKFGKIGVFTPFDELNGILNKIRQVCDIDEINLSSIMYSQSSYGISEKFHNDLPNESLKLKESAKKFFTSNVFDILSNEVFFDEKPNDSNSDYIKLYGRSNNLRIEKWIKREYVINPGNLDFYKVLIANANGYGSLGEILSNPIVGHPNVGHTQTFISIGKFATVEEAQNCLKYIKSKFARVCLGILKITQHNPPEKWKYVPLQDFTEKSDIDWSKSIHEIDQQLYKKYGLTEEEIKFIETKVKSMDVEE